MKVTTVVQFNTNSSDYIFNVELDDVLNVDSNGDTLTTFDPLTGYAHLRVNKSSNVSILEVATTYTPITLLGYVNRTGEVNQLFAARASGDDGDTYELSVIPSVVTVSYIGNDGKVYREDDSIGRVTYTPEYTMTPFIAKLTYDYRCLSYRLDPPGMTLDVDETYDVGVVFYIGVN